MSQNVRRGIKDGSDYQWMRSQQQHHSGQYHHQPQATHHQQYPYSSNSHQLYPTTGGMGHHPYYAPPAHPSSLYPYNDQSGHHHHQGSWSNGSAAVTAVDHHHPHGMTFPSHPLAYTSPHHDPSAHQYMDMFSSPPVQSPYGYNNSYHHHHHEQPVSEPFWTPNTKEDEGQQQPQDYYDPSEQDGMNSLETGMNSLTVDTTFSDRELFSRDLELFKKNQAYASSQRKEQSSWASVAAGSKNKTALLKAKMLASRPTTETSIPNSIETSPNSSTWGESSKNGYSPKTPPTPSSSIGSSSAPNSTSSVPPASSSIPSNQESRPSNYASSQRNAFPGPTSSHHPPSSSSFNRSTGQTSNVSNGRQPPHDQRNQGSWRQHSLQDNNYASRDDRTRQPPLKEDKQNDRNSSDDRKVERILERPTAASSSRPRPVVARSSTSESDQHNTTSSSCSQSVPNPSASKVPLKPVIDPSLVMDKQQLEHIYNPKTFDLDPVDARFFVIKSYSEDDIHRSIKYSIWCSTEHGNKRLDTAFKSQEGRGPVYLLYSVNGSGHFCGMAQMMSPLDYHSSANVWAQDKWKGQFKVKWIYVKDVPNSQLRHIRLENNENKPVTNSRDTQEVFAEQGKQVLSIIHTYRHTTSIFDDYLHYEKRQEEVSRQKKSESDASEVTQSRDVSRDKPGRDAPRPGFGRGNRDDLRRNHPNDKAFSSRDHPSSEFDDRRGGNGRQPFFSNNNNNNNNFHSSQQQFSYSSNYSRDRGHNHHNRHRPSNFNSRREHDIHSSWRQ